MLEILVKAGSYVLMIIIGYVMKRAGIFGREAVKILSNIILMVTLPAAVISSFANYNRQMSLAVLVLFGIFMNLLFIGIGYLSALRKSNTEKSFGIINYSGYNIGTFAMPYLQNFIGPMGIVVAVLFDTGNAIMTTGVTYAIASRFVSNAKFEIAEFIRKVTSSVPFDIYVVMMLLYFMNIRLPWFIYEVAGNIGRANAFLSMFMIGIVFEIPKNLRQLGDVFKILLIRYSVSALASIILYSIPIFSLEVRQILIILLFSPVSGVNVISTLRCNADVEKSGAINSISIILSLIIMTLLIQVFGY
ncbi:putative permease [Youngiibacter multivorans]|uniref:Permease n=2 Tax=Youngiibacter multivorans TaxID=937251 RepID=A0ABS4G8J3_9CLOT|nr:putative permease [Youngiibacter multivorans]